MIRLVDRITCPHCWQSFPPAAVCWISAHQDLLDDARLGPDAQQRFLPSRFNADGMAIDSRGLVCREIACPHCHLRVPRALLYHRPFFVSIAGSPSCGKSFLLAALTWQMRQQLPRQFCLDFTDADPEANRILADYEQQLFVSPHPDRPVKLAKTQEEGDWYNHITYEDQTVRYPQPFLFDVRPGQTHPAVSRASSVARLVCLYDNAGESFQPGRDTAVNAVTRHLAAANAWLFCLDPTQDPQFRTACAGLSRDPQILEGTVTSRQETLFHEMISRIRKHGNLMDGTRVSRPLIILCTKYDAWRELLGAPLDPPCRVSESRAISILDLGRLRETSDRLEKLIARFSPALVSAARSFSSNTWFLPVSATGASPVRDEHGVMGFRPRDLRPIWCEYPVLLALSHSAPGLVAVRK